MTTETGTFETRSEAISTSGNDVKAWLQAISISKKAEKKWRKKAKEVSDIFVNEGEKTIRYNILFSNTQTIVPAVYNSQPIPDIRERFGENPVGQNAAHVMERAVSFNLDNYNFHATMADTVLDACLLGRGVGRVRYEPDVSADEKGNQFVRFQKTYCELVDWDSVVFGPSKRWENLPWVAFEHLMTREQLVKLAPKVGNDIKMEEVVNGVDDEKVSETPTMFKRALVYEIWDKEAGEVLFIAPSYKDEVLQRGQPAINLGGFFPIPKPIYASSRTDSMKPVIPYVMYEEQAKDLDTITKRISVLTKCLKWRGVYSKAFTAFAEIENADDGQFIPTEGEFQLLAGMGLDKAVLFMPLESLVTVVRELYTQREQVKQDIYEITGISDILRGSSNASETLGAQQLKAQWGSLRISKIQEDVQRFARDLIRMQCEIIAENFEPSVLSAITGINVDEQTIGLLRDDMMRRYVIDIETDSTIRADLSQAQQNVSQFVQGFGAFIQSVGPAVQSGDMPKEVVIELLLSFTRNFKLGRQAEAALDKLKTQQTPPQQDNAAIQDQANAQAESQKLMLEKYKIDADNQTKLQIAQIQAQTDLQIASMKPQERPFGIVA